MAAQGGGSEEDDLAGKTYRCRLPDARGFVVEYPVRGRCCTLAPVMRCCIT
jgi:hypothetical protein